jgi:N-acetylmuramoyl-L-alanine amidase
MAPVLLPFVLNARWLRIAFLAVTVLLAQVLPSIAAKENCGDPPSALLDIGHTPKQPGAVSARGKKEYHFNLNLSLKLAAALQELGFEVDVLNKQGREISLAKRASLISDSESGVVISLHHDSVQPIYVKRGTIDGKSASFSRHARGYSLFVSGRSDAFEASKKLARSIGKALRSAGFTPSKHHAEPIKGEGRPFLDSRHGIFRYDNLVVLKAARVPAVLVEAGVILNPEEELLLEDPVLQGRMTWGLAKGVAHYCGPEPGSKMPVPQRRPNESHQP